MMALRNQISVFGRMQWTLGAAVVLTLGAFMAFGYRPIRQHSAAVQTQIDRCRQELSMHRDQAAILSAVKSDVRRLEERLSGFKRLPQQQELAEFIKDVAQLAQQAQLKKPDIRPQGMIQRGPRLTEAPIQLTFEGDFTNVYWFLQHAEDLKRLTRVPTLSIKTKDRYGQVKVQMTMNLYCAIE